MNIASQHELLSDTFSTPQMRDVFSAVAMLQGWLDVERALAEVQADVGEIPKSAARRIASESDAGRFDLGKLSAEIVKTGHPLVPLIGELSARCGEEGAFVHWGATTQDIVDTGLMLQCRNGLRLLRKDVAATIQALLGHARSFRSTPMAGRTHMQHAAPVTFGYKISIWIDELLQVYRRLDGAEKSLTGQFAGAVGTLASLPDRGPRIRDGLCSRLGLQATPVPWQASRGQIREIADALQELSVAAERIGLEIVRLQSTEVGEASEPISDEHVGSSTMPQKRNPHSCEFMVAGARLMRGAIHVLQAYGVHAHERDMASWAIEWVALPQAFVHASGVASYMRHIGNGLEAFPERMASNLELTQGQIMAESVMMRLARHIGHEQAHKIVAEATRTASARGVPLARVLSEDDRVIAHLKPEDIDAAVDPSGYLGQCEDIVDAVIAAADRTDISLREREKLP